MKKIILLLFICLKSQAQIQFWNTNASSKMPLFEVEWNKKTTIYTKVGKETKPMYVFNKTAVQTFNDHGKTKYQMTVENSDKIAKRIFEISYTHYRQTNIYLGYIKTTFVYHNKRPTKIVEEKFETLKNS